MSSASWKGEVDVGRNTWKIPVSRGEQTQQCPATSMITAYTSIPRGRLNNFQGAWAIYFWEVLSILSTCFRPHLLIILWNGPSSLPTFTNHPCLAFEHLSWYLQRLLNTQNTKENDTCGTAACRYRWCYCRTTATLWSLGVLPCVINSYWFNFAKHTQQTQTTRGPSPEGASLFRQHHPLALKATNSFHWSSSLLCQWIDLTDFRE